MIQKEQKSHGVPSTGKPVTWDSDPVAPVKSSHGSSVIFIESGGPVGPEVLDDAIDKWLIYPPQLSESKDGMISDLKMSVADIFW